MNDPTPASSEALEAPQPRLTKREYFAVHLFQGVTANLSANCTLRDKATYAVEAADALIRALDSPPKDAPEGPASPY